LTTTLSLQDYNDNHKDAIGTADLQMKLTIVSLQPPFRAVYEEGSDFDIASTYCSTGLTNNTTMSSGVTEKLTPNNVCLDFHNN